jgi:cytochrome c biogenesis protein ResB
VSSAAPSAPRQGPPEPHELLWRWLNSLPIAIAVMLALALLSALGTLVPQVHLLSGEDAANPAAMYISRFGETRYHIIDALGLNRIYFTWYFFALLSWLSVSAVVCNITRLRNTLRLWRTPPVVRREQAFNGKRGAAELSGVDPAKLHALKAELAKDRFRVREADDGGARCVYADRGFGKKWGLVLLHFSLIVLLAGAIFGRIFGVVGQIRLADGEKQSLTLDRKHGKRAFIYPLLDRLAPLTFALSQDRFRIDYDKSIVEPESLKDVDPELREYYRYFVRDFVSTLTASRYGAVKSQEVKVNHPLVLNKLVIYQSGYQQIGYVNVTDGAESREYPVVPEQWLVLTPEGPALADQMMMSGNAMSSSAFLMEQVKAGDLYQRGKKVGYIGPLTIVHITDIATERTTSQLLSADQFFETTLAGKTMRVSMAKRVDNYSDFAYKRDPAIPLLYFGWISLIIGVALSLYLPFTQVWIRLSPSDAGGQTARMLVQGPGGADAAASHYARWHDILRTP